MNERQPERRTGEEEPGERILKKLDQLSDYVQSGRADNDELRRIRALLTEALGEPEEEGEPVSEVEEAIPEVVPPEEVEELKPSITCEQARADKRSPLTDEFVHAALQDNLMKGGDKMYGMDKYFAMVPADASDKEFARDHTQVIAFRNELSDLVRDELKITAPSHLQGLLERSQHEFNQRLEDGKRAFRDYVDGREKRLSLQENRVPHGALEFRGFTALTDNGDIDLLEGSVRDVYVNLNMQRGLGETFVRWSSDSYIEGKKAGQRPKLAKRVYLNPRIMDSVAVFKDVIHAVSEAGLAAKGKLYDRTTDSDVMKPYDAPEPLTLRGDEIVFVTTEEEADQLLAIVEQVYQRHETAFEGRELSSMPYELRPGMGIGDESGVEDESLNSHRSKVIAEVLQRVRESGETDEQKQIALFHQIWREEALNAGINPDNPAFNLTEAVVQAA